MTKFYFAYDLLICIHAETQAQAEAKLLARFDLLGIDTSMISICLSAHPKCQTVTSASARTTA